MTQLKRLLSDRTYAVSRLMALMGLGAANDNLLKMALVVAVSVGLFETHALPPVIWVNLAGLVFIAPFVVLATRAANHSVNVSARRRVMQLKGLEVVLSGIALLALWWQSAPLLLLAVAGLGIQSALLGPLKYALLPQWVPAPGLSGANACLQTITFVSILVGTALGSMGVLGWPLGLGLLCLILAGLGWWLSSGLPSTVVTSDAPVASMGSLIATIRATPTHRAYIHLISGFWAIGSVWLAHLSLLISDVWLMDASLVPGILTLFVVGVGMGSGIGILAQGHTLWLRVGLGVVALCFAGLLTASGHPMIGLLGVWLTAAGGGFMVLPLYVAMQRDSGSVVNRIAVLNLYNAVAMMAASLVSMVVIAGVGIPLVLWLGGLAVLQLCLCLYHRSDLLLSEQLR